MSSFDRFLKAQSNYGSGIGGMGQGQIGGTYGGYRLAEQDQSSPAARAHRNADGTEDEPTEEDEEQEYRDEATMINDAEGMQSQQQAPMSRQVSSQHQPRDIELSKPQRQRTTSQPSRFHGLITPQLLKQKTQPPSASDDKPQIERQTSTQKRMSAIPDEEVRRLLSPDTPTDFHTDVATWSREQIDLLVEHFSPNDYSTVLDKVARWQKESGTLQTAREISFRNLWYQKDGKTRLYGVTGFVRPGMLVGVLGAPDGGATTLFNIITGRQKGGEISGELLLDGKPRGRDFAKQVGYLQKEDNLFAVCTVYETLMFSARLRRKTTNDNVLHLIVSTVLKLLGLYHVRDTVIGDANLRGVSGGERRRVSVACEQVAGCHTIVADLPTNGLDSSSAYSLFRHVKVSNRMGNSMIASVVQPSPELYSLFDYVMLLCKGSAVFFGPTKECLPFIESQGFIRPKTKSVPQFLEELSATPERFWQLKDIPIPIKERPLLRAVKRGALPSTQQQQQKQLQSGEVERQNSGTVNSNTSNGSSYNEEQQLPGSKSFADVKKLNVEDKDGSQQCDDPAANYSSGARERYTAWRRLVDGYSQSIFYDDVGYLLHNEMSGSMTQPPVKQVDAKFGKKRWFQQYDSGFGQQLKECIHRQALLVYRNWGLWMFNFIRSLVMGVILGTLFMNLSTDASEARVRFGLFFFFISYFVGASMQLISVLSYQRIIVQPQIAASYFHPFCYYLSLVLVFIPVALIETFLFIIIVYPAAGLAHGIASSYFGYVFTMTLVINLTARSWVILLSTVLNSQAAVSSLAGLAMVAFSLFSGFMAPKDTIPSGWIWMYYIDYFTYAIRGLANNELWGIGQQDQLNLYDMYDNESKKWTYLSFVVYFFIGFNVAAAVGTTLVDFTPADREEPPDFEPVKEDDASQYTPTATPRKKKQNTAVVPHPDGQQHSSDEVGINVGDQMTKPQGYISFEDLCYSVDVPSKTGHGKEQRKLLNNVYGYARPGQLVALMGASGAGKTTLLDVLAQKKTGGHTSGKIMVNGKPIDHNFSRQAGYVEQFDSHNEQSTIREAIRFSARMRLPSSTSAEDIEQKVKTILKQLGLRSVADDQIGSAAFGGVTPDQRKKTTIAVELVMDPQILFLDEPTTGLDSAGALSVMTIVKKLCKENHISAICTLHQPNNEIVQMFDTLLLCKPGGEVAFYGDFHDVQPYLEETHLAKHEADRNVADIAIEAMSRVKNNGGYDLEGNQINLAEKFKQSKYAEPILKDLREGIIPEHLRANIEHDDTGSSRHHHKKAKPPTGATMPTQIIYLMHRNFVSTLRDKPALIARWFAPTLLAFIVGTLFFRMALDQTHAANRISIIYLAILFMANSGMIRLPQQFAARPVYFRERQANMYTPFSYWVSRTVADLPFEAVEVLIFTVMVYWIAGLTAADATSHFWLFVVTIMGARFSGQQFTDLFGGLFAELATTNTMVSVAVQIFTLFSGFLIQKPSIPSGWIWMYYLSYPRYPLAFLAANELITDVFTCDASQLETVASTYTLCPSQPNPNSTGPQDALLKCPLACGYELLDQFGISYQSGEMALNAGMVWAFFAGFAFLNFLVIKHINHIKR